MKYIYVTIFSLLFFFNGINAQKVVLEKTRLSDNSDIYVITCEAGKDIYKLFGHSAVRVQDRDKGLDMIFNYGTFNFNTPNFYMKFTSGRLLYQLGITSFDSFIYPYIYEKINVYSQRLLLSQEKKQEMFDLMMDDYKPENKYYRYNFLYDNCSTRIRDLINRVEGDKIKWGYEPNGGSYWEYLDKHLTLVPWIGVGIHIILGEKGNKKVNSFDASFLPENFMQCLKDTKIGGENIVDKAYPILQYEHRPAEKKYYEYPFWILFLVVIINILLSIRFKMYFRITSIFILLISGIIGVVISYLGLFTSHPMTFLNADIIWANPLNMIMVYFLIIGKYPKCVVKYFNIYMIINLIGLVLWLILSPSTHLALLPILLMMIFISNKLTKTNYGK